MNSNRNLLSLRTPSREHRAHFQSLGWDLIFRKFLKSFRINWTVSFFRLHFDALFLARFHSSESFLQTGNDLLASMGVFERFFALVRFDCLSVLTGKRVFEAHNRAVLDDIGIFVHFS